MKLSHYLLTIILLFSQNIWSSDLDTGKNSGFMSATEKEIIFELNKVRSNPSRYANEYMKPLLAFYNDKKFTYPGHLPVITSEGNKAMNECIRYLKDAKSASPLQPAKGLCLAASDHVNDQATSGGIGHFGTDASKPIDRMERHGTWDVCAAENISYGTQEARQIVISLLVDDGIPGRGHRENILNPAFKVIGISFGKHPEYGFMSVMDFAGAYSDDEQ